MTWTTAVSDLRAHLSDGSTDRYRYRKLVLGPINGTNTLFKTFEFRRITNFTTAVSPLGVYKNGVLLSVGDLSSDSPDTGEFVLKTAPIGGDYIEASYYIQWFLDTELTGFLSTAANWLGFASNYTTIPEGLYPAAIQFASSEAYLKMAMRWKESQSDTFKMDDAPDGSQKDVSNSYMQMAAEFYKLAEELKRAYYTRQGRNLQPSYGFAAGAVRNVTPSR